MTTVTLTAIITHLVGVVEDITPSALATRPFRRNAGAKRPLRRWLPDAGGNDMLRRFELRRAGAREDLGIQDPSANLVAIPLELTLCYPADPKLFFLSQDFDLEAAVESDVRLIRDALTGPSGLASAAHHANFVTVEALDQSDEKVWFQPLSIVPAFYIAQELS